MDGRGGGDKCKREQSKAGKNVVVSASPGFSVIPRVHNVLRLRLRLRHIIGSAEALPILCVREREREREREILVQRDRDGSDVIIVALKLAMRLHIPLPKVHTIGDDFTLSLAKNLHFSFLPSHFPSLHS